MGPLKWLHVQGGSLRKLGTCLAKSGPLAASFASEGLHQAALPEEGRGPACGCVD